LKKQGYDYKFIPEGEKKMAKKLTESQKEKLATLIKLVKDSNNNKLVVYQLKQYMKKLGIEPKAVKKEAKPKEVKPKEVKPKEEKISEVDMYPHSKGRSGSFRKRLTTPPIRKAVNKISPVDKTIKSTLKKDSRFKKRTGTVPKEVFKKVELKRKPKIAPKIAPIPKRKPIDTSHATKGVTLSPKGTVSRLKAKQRVRDVTLPRSKGPSQLQRRLQEERKITKAPEEDSPAAYHAAKAAKIKAEPKPKKDKPFWERLFGTENIEYTYPEEINDKKGGYLKKDLKKAKARRRAALRGHRKELRGG